MACLLAPFPHPVQTLGGFRACCALVTSLPPAWHALHAGFPGLWAPFIPWTPCCRVYHLGL